MPCFHPLKGYRSRELNPSGKRSITFNPAHSYRDWKEVQLPCGQCIGCRLERSRRWAVRCLHESKLHDDNAFITLTYSDEHLPKRGTLVLSDFQKFMKLLRKKRRGETVRYFMCGEYGEEKQRPHYHACLFGIDFPDRKKWSERNGQIYYRSEELESLWRKGNSMVGDVTFESAAYVARYITKKALGPGSERFYEGIDEETGEIYSMQPEFVTMSRRPGIGKDWYERYKGDCYPSDFIIVRGKKTRVPKYYDNQLEKEDPALFARLRAKREAGAKCHQDDQTVDRLEVKEIIQYENLNRLKRSFESGS